MNRDFWVRVFFETVALLTGAVILAAGCILASWLTGPGIEVLTRITPAGYFTFGVLLITMVTGSMTLVRRHS